MRIALSLPVAFLASVVALVAPSLVAAAEGPAELPVGSAPPALTFPHFPDRLHAFLWRNWNVVPSGRLAEVLGATRENVRALAASMGMPKEAALPEAYKTRGYITIIRRNWHLLPPSCNGRSGTPSTWTCTSTSPAPCRWRSSTSGRRRRASSRATTPPCVCRTRRCASGWPTRWRTCSSTSPTSAGFSPSPLPHCANLAKEEVDGMMLSWSLGGYPSPNLDVANRFSADPAAEKEAVLDAVAHERYGTAAPHARAAWTAFSDAFREYPYTNEGLYVSPNSYGPSNLLYATPTRYSATMLGYPYDQVHAWRGIYPAEVFAQQLEKVSAGWRRGLAELEKAVAGTAPQLKADADAELRFARVSELHFRSVANQTRFVVARDALIAGAPDRAPHVETIRRVVADEMAAATELFALARDDSRVGYEASNQYYYLPQDLVEKVVNCRHVLDQYPQ